MNISGLMCPSEKDFSQLAGTNPANNQIRILTRVQLILDNTAELLGKYLYTSTCTLTVIYVNFEMEISHKVLIFGISFRLFSVAMISG